jgi:hypothetical protein
LIRVRPWSTTSTGRKWNWMSGAPSPGWLRRKPPDSAIGEVPGPFLSFQ